MSNTLRRTATASGVVSGTILGLSLIMSPAAFADSSHPHPQPTPVGAQQAAGGNTAEKPNNGGYKHSSEALHNRICANMLQHLKDTQAELNSQHDRNSQDDINSARQDVSDAYDQGFKAGCWGQIG